MEHPCPCSRWQPLLPSVEDHRRVRGPATTARTRGAVGGATGSLSLQVRYEVGAGRGGQRRRRQRNRSVQARRTLFLSCPCESCRPSAPPFWPSGLPQPSAAFSFSLRRLHAASTGRPLWDQFLPSPGSQDIAREERGCAKGDHRRGDSGAEGNSQHSRSMIIEDVEKMWRGSLFEF